METKKYLVFDLVEHKPKTNVYWISLEENCDCIGKIEWNPAWRQYWAFIDSDVGMTYECLKQLTDFVEELNQEQKLGKHGKRNDLNKGMKQ